MSVAAFALGLIVMAAVVVPLAVAGRRLRVAFVPCPWPLTLLADVVVTLGLVVVVGEVAGTVGQFDRLGLVVGSAVVMVTARWLTVRRVGRSAGRATVVEEQPARPMPRWGWLLATGLVALVVAQWTSHSLYSLTRGVTDIDSQVYHLPVAARFAQEGHTSHLALIWSEPFVAYHTENAELLHGLGMVAFGGRDLLSPVLNMGWLALALFSGWCAGRRFGVGPLTTAAVAMVVSVPVLAAVNAGSAGTDIAAIALLLAAAAFLVYDRLDHTAVVSGLAAGLAIGTKEGVIAIAAALLVAVVVTVPRATRGPTALWWSSGAMLGGIYWFLRNLVRTGNPVPTMRLGIGSLRLPTPDLPVFRVLDHRTVEYLTDTRVLREVFAPGLRAAFGSGRFLLAASLVGALLVATARGGVPRRLAAVAVVGIAAYLVTPFTAWGPKGSPIPLVVSSNFRYLASGAAMAVVAGSLALAQAGDRVRAAALLLVAATIGLTEVSSGGFFLAWRPREHQRVALLAGVAVALVVVTAAPTAARWARRMGPRRRLGVVALLAAAAVVAGPTLATSYLRHRYRTYRGVDPVVAAAGRELEGQRIGVTGLQTAYPLYSPTLANHVVYIGRPRPHGGFADPASCPDWRRAVNDGHFDYVVVAPPVPAPFMAPIPPASSWTSTDPGAVLVAREDRTELYRITAALHPGDCPEQ